MKNAISAGLGLFIALIGLLNSGIVRAEDGALLLGEIGAPATFLAILGLLITGVLMAWKVKGAMLIGIVVTTLLGFPLGVTQAPESMSLSLSALRPLLMSPDFGGVLSLGVMPLVTAVVTFTMSITTGVMLGVVSYVVVMLCRKRAHLIDPVLYLLAAVFVLNAVLGTLQ